MPPKLSGFGYIVILHLRRVTTKIKDSVPLPGNSLCVRNYISISIYACCMSTGSSSQLASQQVKRNNFPKHWVLSHFIYHFWSYIQFSNFVFFSYLSNYHTNKLPKSTNKVTPRKAMVIPRYPKNDLVFTMLGTTFCNR